MPFNSVEYFIFLWATVLVFYSVPDRFKKHLFLLLSYAFYCSWSVYFGALLLSMTVLGYAAPLVSRKRLCFLLSLALTLGVFIFFKGLSFWKPMVPADALSRVVMPIGLSYYLFRLISYLIDVYWEKRGPEKDFVSFAAYIAFFPHILSGPIMRADEFLPQLQTSFGNKPELWSKGLRLILCGLLKKLIVADNFSVIVENVFGHYNLYNSTALWVASYSFYIQLYADFSGLADIAIGSGMLFGIESPANFNAPYLAKNIQDFWRRWHITLCRWITDYVFLPLRMMFRGWGEFGLILSIFLNMLAISLWHGVSTGFVAFALLQGVFVSVSVFTLKQRDAFFKKRKDLSVLRNIAAPLITFHMLVFSFIYFRSKSFHDGSSIILKMFRGPFEFDKLSMGMGPKGILMYFAAFVGIECFARLRFETFPRTARWGLYYLALAGLFYLGRFSSKEFIYFKF